MIYLVYKTTNIINSKFYIGVHKTNNINDGYIGSGTYFKRAVLKYGIENFKREIIQTFDNKKKAFDLEDKLVAKYLGNPFCYNIKEGGLGGFDYINKNNIHSTKEGQQKIKQLLAEDPHYFKKVSKRFRDNNPEFVAACTARLHAAKEKAIRRTKETQTGVPKSEETKRLMSQKGSGENNVAFDTHWIHNLSLRASKRVKKELVNDFLSDGWLSGRKLKFINPT